MNLQIELRPHLGEQVIEGLGKVEVEFDQFVIVVTGEDYKKATGRDMLEVGYVNKQPTVTDPRTGIVYQCPINWLPTVNQWPQPVIDKMAESVQAELARRAEAAQGDKDLVAEGKTRPVEMPPPSVEATSGAQTSASDADSASADNL